MQSRKWFVTGQIVTPYCSRHRTAVSDRVLLLSSSVPALVVALAMSLTACGSTHSRSPNLPADAATTALSISIKTLPSGIVAFPYYSSLTGVGGVTPYFWNISSGVLPNGLTLDNALGVIGGTPKQSGAYAFQVHLTDSLGNNSQTALSIIVVPSKISITTSKLPTADVGVPYAAPLNGFGGKTPYSWSISSGALPEGIELDAFTGMISGSAIEAGNFSFAVTVKDAFSSEATQPLVLTVSKISHGVCGPPNYSCSTTSKSTPENVTPIFASTAPTATTCSGMCQNSKAYDTTLNPRGIDCVTRITDGTTFAGGLSMGNLTFSGGDNDIMGSVNETYLGVNTGQVYILHMNTSGNCIQVVNTGKPAIHVAGPFGFSKVVDTRFYYLVSHTQLWQGDITSDTTWTKTELFDLTGNTGGFTQCPGVDWSTFGTPTSASIMGISLGDGRFGWSVGPGGQGSADWAFVWDRNLGCASVNFATGSYWTFCADECSSSTPPTGTLSTATGTCWGSQGSIRSGHGIHDSQMSGNGKYLQVTLQITGTANVPWTEGSCAGSTSANQQTTWTIGTASTQWSSDNSTGAGGLNSGAHYSTGVAHYLTPNFLGPNIRPLSQVISDIVFAPPVSTTDEHCSWPHPLNDDSYPWVCASDLVTAEQGGVYSPAYLSNVIYAWFPNAASPSSQSPALFSHTFSCGATPDATCSGGGDAAFGAQQSIGVVTQRGNYFCWTSTHLQSLGNDNLGNPRADGFCVHLQ